MAECGTYMGFREGCRCPACRKTWRAYHTAWAWDRRHGGPPRLVPADEVKAYIAMLHRHGWSDRAIADAAGLARCTVTAIRSRDQRKVTPDTRDRILGVTIDDQLDGRRLIPIDDLRALVAAMLAAGLTRKAIGGAMGYRNGWRFALDQRSHSGRRPGRHCLNHTYRRVHTLYRLLAREGLVDGSVLTKVRAP